MGVQIPMGNSNFEEEGRSVVKYRDYRPRAPAFCQITLTNCYYRRPPSALGLDTKNSRFNPRTHNMVDGGAGRWLVRMEWRPAAWSVCLPVLIFPCTVKSRSSLLAPAHPGGPGKRAVNGCGGRTTCVTH